MAVSGVFAGVLEESSGKIAGKLLEIFPGPRNALNSRILGTAKGKPATNIGWVHTALDLAPTFRAGCFQNRQFQPSRVFLTSLQSKEGRQAVSDRG